MNIQNISNIIPIICPQECYIDKYGLPNAYQQCNCSLYYYHDNHHDRHDIIVLVRLVNYRKHHNGCWTGGHNYSYSLYYMLTGSDFNNLEGMMVKYNWGDFRYYDAFWRGMDDIRFINKNTLLVTCSERNESKLPCIFLASLENDTITLQVQLNPHHLEKNWMPFENKVIYMISPFTIKSLIEDDKQVIDIDPFIVDTLAGYHGSTNGLAYKQGYLFLIHKNEKKTIHRWLYYNKVNDVEVRISKPFYFFQHAFFEFPFSLVQYDQQHVMVSIGVNESNSYIIKINMDDIGL